MSHTFTYFTLQCKLCIINSFSLDIEFIPNLTILNGKYRFIIFIVNNELSIII